MGLFKPDLFRAFGLGFVLGAIALVGATWAQSSEGITGQVIPQAEAAASTLPDRTR